MWWSYKNKINYKKNFMGNNTFTYGIYYDDSNITDIAKLRSDACISNTFELLKTEKEFKTLKQIISDNLDIK